MKIWVLLFFVLSPVDCFAYLDPGTGNALICLLVSLFSGAVFYIKKYFYRLVKIIVGESAHKEDKETSIVILCESKNYWYTFKRVINELISRKISFSYYSMDVEDPALRIDNEYMHSRYIGNGSSSFSRISCCHSRILLVTTPNIGCPGYPIKRSSNVTYLMHLPHAVSDISYYKKGSLDYYDVSFDVGTWCQERIRRVENIRHLRQKECIAVGLPYLDELAEQLSNLSEKTDTVEKCVLLAPSWGQKNCLKIHDVKFIYQLLKENFKIILRPHPQSLKVEMDFYNDLQEKVADFCSKNGIDAHNFETDLSVDATPSMCRSSVLISDSSSFKYDYSFLYKKPVVTLLVPNTDLSSFEADILDGPWDEIYMKKFGTVLSPDDNYDIVEAVLSAMRVSVNEIDCLYDSLIVNHGKSAEKIVDYLEEYLNKSGSV